MNRLFADLVGQHPVGAGGNFCQQIRISSGAQIARRGAEDLQIGQNHARRGTGIRILHSVARDRRAE